jgi:uncharacterized coiled-coil protein SlyX
MRINPMWTIVVMLIASTATAYYLWRDPEWTKRAEEARPVIGATSTSDVLDTPVRDGSRDRPAHPEPPRLTQLQEQLAALETRLRAMETAVREPFPRQAGAGTDSHGGAANAKAHKRLTQLQEQLAALEARLRAMETAVREPLPRQALSESDEPASRDAAANAKARKWSDADFVQWMDVALDAGDVDRDAAESVMEQVVTSVAEVPGINLADLQCGARFCRATLIPETGEGPDLAELVGASPFMGSALSVPEPDGSVRVYFVPSGQSFSELQDEAQSTVR